MRNNHLQRRGPAHERERVAAGGAIFRESVTLGAMPSALAKTDSPIGRALLGRARNHSRSRGW